MFFPGAWSPRRPRRPTGRRRWPLSGRSRVVAREPSRLAPLVVCDLMNRSLGVERRPEVRRTALAGCQGGWPLTSPERLVPATLIGAAVLKNRRRNALDGAAAPAGSTHNAAAAAAADPSCAVARAPTS